VNNKQRRIGVLLPPGNITVEREFSRFSPENVACNLAEWLGAGGRAMLEAFVFGFEPLIERFARG
jgi:hypothetical protein